MGSFEISTRIARLTAMQRRCLELTFFHHTSKQIAPLLGISSHSVDAHLRTALKVLGVDTRRDAALLFHRETASQPASFDDYDEEEYAPPTVSRVSVSEDASSYQFMPREQTDPVAIRDDLEIYSAKDSPAEAMVPAAQEHIGHAVLTQDYKKWRLTDKISPSQKIGLILIFSMISALAVSSIISAMSSLSIMLST